jgi:hypothetical protein
MAKRKSQFFVVLESQAPLGKDCFSETETKISRENANVGPAFSHYLNALIRRFPADYQPSRHAVFAFLNIRTN